MISDTKQKSRPDCNTQEILTWLVLSIKCTIQGVSKRSRDQAGPPKLSFCFTDYNDYAKFSSQQQLSVV